MEEQHAKLDDPQENFDMFETHFTLEDFDTGKRGILDTIQQAGNNARAKRGSPTKTPSRLLDPETITANALRSRQSGPGISSSLASYPRDGFDYGMTSFKEAAKYEAILDLDITMRSPHGEERNESRALKDKEAQEVTFSEQALIHMTHDKIASPSISTGQERQKTSFRFTSWRRYVYIVICARLH